MTNFFNLKCPSCGNTDRLNIAATVWVRVTRAGTDSSAPANGDYEWEDASHCQCEACHWYGTVSEASGKPARKTGTMTVKLEPTGRHSADVIVDGKLVGDISGTSEECVLSLRRLTGKCEGVARFKYGYPLLRAADYAKAVLSKRTPEEVLNAIGFSMPLPRPAPLQWAWNEGLIERPSMERKS